MKTQQQILHALRWLAWALSIPALALAASAQSPAPDSFNPGANDWVYSLAVQADGKILVGGYFTTLGGQGRMNLGRLNNTDPAAQNLIYDGSTIIWTRGGSSPEVWRTSFEYSANATDWTSLGAGTRITGLPAGEAGGWQLTGFSLPPGGTIRARGYVAGEGSSWFVETVLTAAPSLAILSQDLGFANRQFGFYFTGPAGQMVIIEASPDLQTWTSVQTNTPGASPVYFSDPESAALSNRFYRLRQGP